MEEELIDNKKPSKLGTVALVQFIISFNTGFWALVLVGVSDETYNLSIQKKIEVISIVLFLIYFASTIAVFPVSIIGIVKDMKNRLIRYSHCTVVLAAHTVILIVGILVLILLSLRAN